jgi:DNA repair exonuclease SbcCD ATPase subunit
MAQAKMSYEAAKTAKALSEKGLSAATDALQKANALMESIERMERHVAERDRTAAQMQAKAKEHDSIKVDERILDEMQSRLIKSTSELSKHAANLESITRFIKDKQAQIGGKQAEVERINSVIEDASRKRKIADNLSKFKAALADTQAALRVQLMDSINGIMHELWVELYPYGDYQGIMLDASDDDYNLRVKILVGGEYAWENVDAIASGGERSTACLAMRIAFSLVLVPNLKWLILDEPTHNIDRQGLDKFVQMFSATLPGIVEQVFIITHDEVLRQVSNARIYTLSRNKAQNMETETSQAA